MGVFDRLRGGGRDRGTRGGALAGSAGVPVPGDGIAPGTGGNVSPGAGSGAGDTSEGGGARAVRPAAWPSLPPIQRATAGRGSVADSGFGGRLTTWQNPSFTGTLSHAVLDGAPGGLVRGVLATPALPASGLELPLALLAGGDTGGDGRPHGRAVRAAREPPGRGDRADGPEGDRRTARGHPASGADRAHQGAGRARGTAAGAAGGDTVRATSYGERPLGVDGFTCRGRGPFRLSLPARLLRGHALGGRSHRRSPGRRPDAHVHGPGRHPRRAGSRGPRSRGLGAGRVPGGRGAVHPVRFRPTVLVRRRHHGARPAGPASYVRRHRASGARRAGVRHLGRGVRRAEAAGRRPHRGKAAAALRPGRAPVLPGIECGTARAARLARSGAGIGAVRAGTRPRNSGGATRGARRRDPVRHRVRRGGFRFRALGCRRSGTTRRVLRCPGPGLVPHPACGQRPAACSRGERLRAVLRPGGAVASARTCAHPRTRVDLGPARRAPGHRGAAPHRPRGRTAASHHGRRRACGWRRFRGRAVRPAPRTPRGRRAGAARRRHRGRAVARWCRDRDGSGRPALPGDRGRRTRRRSGAPASQDFGVGAFDGRSRAARWCRGRGPASGARTRAGRGHWSGRRARRLPVAHGRPRGRSGGPRRSCRPAAHHTDPRGGSVASQRSFGAGQAGGRNAHDLSRPRCDAHRLTGRRHRSLTPPAARSRGDRPPSGRSRVARRSRVHARCWSIGGRLADGRRSRRPAACRARLGLRPRVARLVVAMAHRHARDGVPGPRCPDVTRSGRPRARRPFPGGGSSRRGPYAPRSGGRPGRPASCRRSSRPGRFRRFGRACRTAVGRRLARARWWSGAARSAGLTRPPVGRGPAAGHGSFRVRRTVLHPAARSLGTRTSGGGCAAAHRSPPWFRRPSARHARTAARPGCPRRTAPHRRARGVRWRAVAPALRNPPRRSGAGDRHARSGADLRHNHRRSRSSSALDGPDPAAARSGRRRPPRGGRRTGGPKRQPRRAAPHRAGQARALAGRRTPHAGGAVHATAPRRGWRQRHGTTTTAPHRSARPRARTARSAARVHRPQAARPVRSLRRVRRTPGTPRAQRPERRYPSPLFPPSRPSPSRCNGPRWLPPRRPPRSPARLP